MFRKFIQLFKDPSMPNGKLTEIGYVIGTPYTGSVIANVSVDEDGNTWVVKHSTPILLKRFLSSLDGSPVCVDKAGFNAAKRKWLENFRTEPASIKADEYYEALLLSKKCYVVSSRTNIVKVPDEIIVGLSCYYAKAGNSHYYWEAPSSDIIAWVFDEITQHHFKQK